MMAVDEAKLDELYHELLRMEPDMMLEDKRLRKISQRVRSKERKENQEIRLLRESRRGELLQNASSIFSGQVISPRAREEGKFCPL